VASLFLGIFAAVRPGGLLDRAVTTVALVGLSLPQFWVGLMLIMFFAVIMKVLPTSGMGGPAYLVMPALTLALPSLARLTMLVRSSMIDELNKQYVKTARVKGMSQSSILFRHALRNILVPFLTLCGWELTYGLAGFTVVVESVFAWPGLGYTAMQAIQRNDPFLLQAIVICISFIIVIFNIGLDVLFKLIDPRIKIG
jgi:peptide/nickel transport system permease protein